VGPFAISSVPDKDHAQSHKENMKVLELTWEFPPYISGGLGIACYGLAKALLRHGVEIYMMLPSQKPFFFHLRKPRDADSLPGYSLKEISGGGAPGYNKPERNSFEYMPVAGAAGGYTGVLKNISWEDIQKTVFHYAKMVARAAGYVDFDIIHAHDWLTFPAAVALKNRFEKPLVCHVHSTEYDRSPEEGNSRVHDIERRGLQCADRIIAVSHRTAGEIEQCYGIQKSRIRTVHNASAIKKPLFSGKRFFKEPVVLFLGRLTAQKGPDIFVEVALEVLKKYPDVRFILAGTGDMEGLLIRESALHNTGTRLHFTGFLNRKEVLRILAMSDLLIMPSEAEPFGIAALEAMRFGIPVLVSSQSGVVEIVRNAIPVDNRDIEMMASIVEKLLKEPHMLRKIGKSGRREVKKITWREPARKEYRIFEEILC